jgi:hypothetical protein
MAPILIIGSQCDIECHHTLYAGALQIQKSLRRPRHDEPMQKRLFGLVGRALEELAFSGWKNRPQVVARLGDTGAGHFEQKVMLETIAVRPQPER